VQSMEEFGILNSPHKNEKQQESNNKNIVGFSLSLSFLVFKNTKSRLDII